MPLRRRVAACLRALDADSEADARSRVESSRDRADVALSTLLLGVTSFFRDAHVFDALRSRILPRLAGRSAVRILSAGCASGAELYSVAMLLDEAGLLERATLVGIDCRRDAVASAGAAWFDAASVDVVPPAARARYFEPARGGYRVVERLRRRMDWMVMDVTRALPPGPWDVVLCRNLLMYLQVNVADVTGRCLAAALAPGGALVLGKAERAPHSTALCPLGRSVYQSQDA
jgi:chemotaxis methyl-accepting protein methylase